jgi:hypothetical protein
MAKTKKKRAGKGAICTVITRFIHPKQLEVPDPKHRSKVVLIACEEIVVNRKPQLCYTFTLKGATDGTIFHAVKKHCIVEREGKKEDLFEAPERDLEQDSFEEPKTKWKKSKAKQVLYDLLMEGTVPLDLEDTSMSLEEIYGINDELMKYSFEKFAGRLQSLRESIIDSNNRADEDFEAFATYVRNHEVSKQSYKGYLQWQGSTAQELLWDDLPAYMKDDRKPMDLWKSRPEYQNKWHHNVFRSKLEQEIRTYKYLRTMRERKVIHKAS